MKQTWLWKLNLTIFKCCFKCGFFLVFHILETLKGTGFWKPTELEQNSCKVTVCTYTEHGISFLAAKHSWILSPLSMYPFLAPFSAHLVM